MKRLIVFVILMMGLSYLSHTQELMGIRVGGNKNKFIRGMKSKEFMVEKDYVGLSMAIMGGTIDGNSVDIHIYYTPISKLVTGVEVHFPEEETWGEVKNMYGRYKEILINKYGNPTSDFNTFYSPYKEGDGNEMRAISVDRCGYYTRFDLTNGFSIIMRINHLGSVVIFYDNIENSKIYLKEKKRLKNVTPATIR